MTESKTQTVQMAKPLKQRLNKVAEDKGLSQAEIIRRGTLNELDKLSE